MSRSNIGLCLRSMLEPCSSEPRASGKGTRDVFDYVYERCQRQMFRQARIELSQSYDTGSLEQDASQEGEGWIWTRHSRLQAGQSYAKYFVSIGSTLYQFPRSVHSRSFIVVFQVSVQFITSDNLGAPLMLCQVFQFVAQVSDNCSDLDAPNICKTDVISVCGGAVQCSAQCAVFSVQSVFR